MTDDRHKAISRRAYELWEQEGRPEGRDKENWGQASVDIVDARSDAAEARAVSQKSGSPKKPKAASTAKPRSTKPKLSKS